MSTTILVIGAGGFTGRHLMAHLAANPARWRPVAGRNHGIDLTDAVSIRRGLDAVKPDAVINLAAIATLAVTDRDPIFQVNAFGVLNLLEALAARHFTGRVITASSAYIYGPVDDREPIPEGQPPRPHNLYACAKVLAESFCAMYRDRLDVVVTRPFNAIGRGHRESFLVPKIVRHFRQRAAEIELGNIAVARDYTDVRDIARMYELLLAAQNPPEVLHLCNGTAVSIEALIGELTRLTGQHMDIKVNPAFIRPNDVLYQCGATDSLNALGFRWQYRLADTLGWMLDE